MSTTPNIVPSFLGSVLPAASHPSVGERIVTTLADLLPLLATDTAIGMALVSPAPATLTLPALSAIGAEPGLRVIRIFDRLGQWGDNPFTVVASGTDKIDGESSVTLSQPFGCIILESRGTYWHVDASGLLGFGGMGGGFGPDLLPTPATTDDDEFNGLTLSSAWQLLGATVQVGDPQRGVSIVGPNVVRQSLSVRNGWFMFQPDVAAYYSKLLATSLTTGMVYVKFSMDSNAGVGPDVFALLLGQSTAGNLDIDNAVSVSLGRAVGSNTWTLKAEKRVAAVSTTVYTATLDSFVQPFDRMQIYRNGTTFAFFVGSEAGGFKALGSTTAALAPDRMAFGGSATGGPSPVFGLDYVRRLDGVYPTV